MPSVYISSEGSVLRNSTVARRLSRLRISLFLCLFVALAVTNPPNYAFLNETVLDDIRLVYGAKNVSSAEPSKSNHRMLKRQRKKEKILSWEIFGYEFDLHYRLQEKQNNSKSRRYGTNFALFSLDDKGVSIFKREVVMGILLQEFPVCEYNLIDDETFCSWLAENACHEMFLSRKFRAYTAHRIISALFVLSVVLSFSQKCFGFAHFFNVDILSDPFECSLRNVASWENLLFRPHAVLMSVFYRPSLIIDLILLNVIAYPPLVLMENACSFGLGKKNELEVDLRFAFSIFITYFVIGGVSNVVASVAAGRGCFGVMGAFAALLGYQTAVAPASILISKAYIGIDVTAVDVLVFLTIFEILNVGKWWPSLFHELFANTFFLWRKEGTSSPVAWVVGGLLGIAYGHYHVETYSLHWRLW